MNAPLTFLMLVCVLLATVLDTQAQTTGQRHRIGLLNAAAPGGLAEAALREGLRAIGYIEGANLVIEARPANGRVEQLPALARELLDGKPEVIVTFGTTAAGPPRRRPQS